MFRDSFRHILILKPVIGAIMFYASPTPSPAKHREVQVSVFEPVLKWTTLHRVLKEEEVDFKDVCCSCGHYFCGEGIQCRAFIILCLMLFDDRAIRNGEQETRILWCVMSIQTFDNTHTHTKELRHICSFAAGARKYSTVISILDLAESFSSCSSKWRHKSYHEGMFRWM